MNRTATKRLLLAIVSCSAILMGCSETKGQLLEVYDIHGSKARARLTIDGTEVFTTDVFIGKNGIGKTREGDWKTPAGTLHVTRAFGVKPNPGTALPFLDITPTTFACDDEGEYYNRVIDTAATHHPCGGEDMYRIVPEYNYGLMTDYNAACTYPLGNSIFIHCKGSNTYTGGCIALDEQRMIELLQRCDTSLVIRIGK